jgi:hypothetical protein
MPSIVWVLMVIGLLTILGTVLNNQLRQSLSWLLSNKKAQMIIAIVAMVIIVIIIIVLISYPQASVK